jgi:uncharacterized small protein (DUF1192 family)
MKTIELLERIVEESGVSTPYHVLRSEEQELFSGKSLLLPDSNSNLARDTGGTPYHVLRMFEISICNGFSLSLPDSLSNRSQATLWAKLSLSEIRLIPGEKSKLARDTGGEEVAERMLEIVVEDISAALKERVKRPPEVPPYFDRYVTAEISHLSAQITHLREDIFKEFGVLREEIDGRFGALQEEMERRFGVIDERFGALREEMERRFGELRGEMDMRFGALREEMDRRFAEMDRRFNEMDKRFGAFREEMRREIDRLERWFFAFGVPIILGILAIIIKIFFMP